MGIWMKDTTLAAGRNV